MWRADVFTLFPEMFPGPLGISLAGDALQRGLWQFAAHDIRDQGIGRHRSVDDTPSGGGPGMVMRADVLGASLDACLQKDDPRPRLVMSPRGKPLTQARVRNMASTDGVVIVCGRFEGIDERVILTRGLEEVSIGDYVLSGGELAAMVLIDSCVRLLPGVMGKEASGQDESFENGLLEYPHYTKPRTFEGHDIPSVLLSGDHAKVEAWRRAEAQRITKERRPELLEKTKDTKKGEV
jgi:tRNA (guanine37-N1)-methyltransferase